MDDLAATGPTASKPGLGEGAGAFKSDLDAVDFCFAFAAGLSGVFAATNRDVARWLEGVHNAASGKPGDLDMAQLALGDLLRHEGDCLDVFAPGNGFVGRNGERAYVMFHRLLFGHDVLARGEGLMAYNPFTLMFRQQGVSGIAQAARHLVADTMSKQGLPVPGSSYLDVEKDGGRPWNRIIDWVQELSEEACGDKKMAQEIYSHMFTIRAQDVAAAGLVAALDGAYFQARGVDDGVRRAQASLVSVSVAFFGQAAVGTTRQKGVPYVNSAMVPQLAKAYAGLIATSGARTAALGRETGALCDKADGVIAAHEHLKMGLAAAGRDQNAAAAAKSADKLVDFLEA